MPPGGVVRKSSSDNRWRMSLGKYTVSRCWSLYGELPAFSKAARHIWERHAALTGQKCPFEWILAAEDE